MLSRIVWVLVFALGTVLLVPQLRARARPQIEYVLNPVYRWEARNRIQDVQRVLVRERSQGATLPRPRDFTRFLATREGEKAALDPWNEPYYLVTTRQSFRVGSAGPDRVRNTPDDILTQPERISELGKQRRR